MKYELEKILHQRKLIAIVTILLLAIYVYLAFHGSYDTFCGISIDYFWENEEYRQWEMSKNTEQVDEDWIREKTEAYQKFVDENRLSSEEITSQYNDYKSKGFQLEYTIEDALADPYNIKYSLVVLSHDAYQSREMSDVYWPAFRTYIPLSQNPAQYLSDKYKVSDSFWMEDMGMGHMDYMGYSKAQQKDYWDFVSTAYDDFTLTIGYSLGWDALCGIMKFLPYTLGMVLIIILGNLFSQERGNSMNALIKTTKNGRSKLLRKKVVLAIVISTVLWLLFQLEALLSIGLTYTLEGAHCTVMSFSGEPSLYGLTWLQYYLISCAFSYMGTLVFALFICCVSSLLVLRVSLPVNMILTLLTGIPLNHFCYADQAFQLLDKIRAVTPAQLMASYPTLQVYQSYEFGSFIVRLPIVMAGATILWMILTLFILHRREGGK